MRQTIKEVWVQLVTINNKQLFVGPYYINLVHYRRKTREMCYYLGTLDKFFFFFNQNFFLTNMLFSKLCNISKNSNLFFAGECFIIPLTPNAWPSCILWGRMIRWPLEIYKSNKCYQFFFSL